MGILKRIKGIVVAETNGLLDQLENPVHMLDQNVREAEEEVLKGQQALANQLFIEKRQAALIYQTQEVIQKRTRQAKLAVERDEDEVAKIALQEKLMQEEKLKLYETQYETIKNQTANLSDQLNQLRAKVEEFWHRKLLLVSKLKVNQTLKQMTNTFTSFSTDNVARGFARVEEHILLLESEVEAGQRMVDPSGKVNNFTIDHALQERVEEELEKLKTPSN